MIRWLRESLWPPFLFVGFIAYTATGWTQTAILIVLGVMVGMVVGKRLL